MKKRISKVEDCIPEYTKAASGYLLAMNMGWLQEGADENKVRIALKKVEKKLMKPTMDGVKILERKTRMQSSTRRILEKANIAILEEPVSYYSRLWEKENNGNKSLEK